MASSCSNCSKKQTDGQPPHIITACKILGDHLTDCELSSVIAHQIRNARQHSNLKANSLDYKDLRSSESGAESYRNVGSARTCVPFADKHLPPKQTVDTNRNHTTNSSSIPCTNTHFHSSVSMASDCKHRHDYAHSEKPTLEKIGNSTSSEPQNSKPSSMKRKCVIKYTTSGYAAAPKSTKFGSDTFLNLCRQQDYPDSRLTFQSYREQMQDIVKDLNRGDLLPTLQQARPLFKDMIEEHYMRSKLSEETNMKRVLRSATRQQPQPSLTRRQSSRLQEAKNQPVTCEVKMRVRIQYKSHIHLLSGIESSKNSPEERQRDKFYQASSIMRERDTGCVVCNISFSDITYLGAFWRDYINGSLQEALRGVFLTEMMRQTAAHEELDLLVSVDENDFMEGQKKLVKNLKTGNVDSASGSSFNVRGQLAVPTTARIEHV